MEIKIKKLKKQVQGITLVSLVVTIIVLLILAGVALNFTLGENGIFKKAGDAVDKYKEAQEKDKNMLIDLESSMDNIIGEPIPIKTEEQLLKIGSGEKVEVDGVEYFFNTGRKYILQNDIETSKEYEKIAEKVKNREILLVGNGNKIVETREDGTKAYYTEDSNFYIAVNKYGYVLDGLELYYDGIDNAGEGNHDNNSTVWKDLSGKGHDGVLTNFGNSSISGWHNNYLSFDGVNDWVNCGEINYPNVTLEATYIDKSGTSKEPLGNWDGGGNGLAISEGKYTSSAYSKGEYKVITTNINTIKNEMVTQSMTYNGENEELYLKGETIGRIQVDGYIEYPINNTVMAIRM